MQDREGNIIDRREMLRVKVKSLADEARIIRREESRSYGSMRAELHNHRVIQVRQEARAAHLALGLIKGRTFEQMERPDSAPRDDKRVQALVRKFGPATLGGYNAIVGRIWPS